MVIEMLKKDYIKNIFKLIIVFFIFYKSYLLQYIPIILFKIDIKNISMSTNILLNIFSNLVLLVIFFFIYKKELIEEFKIFKKNLLENINTGFKYWFVGLIIMIFSNALINIFFKTGGATNEKTIQSMITSLPWIMLINAGLIAPFNEEIVFRKSLKGVIKNRYLFVILSFLKGKNPP